MIGLPHGIGVRCFSPIEQVERFTVGSGSFMSHRHERRVEVLDNLAHPLITRRLPSLFVGNGDHFSMDGSG
jgi:hypothetical protein